MKAKAKPKGRRRSIPLAPSPAMKLVLAELKKKGVKRKDVNVIWSHLITFTFGRTLVTVRETVDEVRKPGRKCFVLTKARTVYSPTSVAKLIWGTLD
jgi:hypothetical protein